MAMTFRDYLINEVMVDLDPNDPESLTRVRQDIRLAQQDPEKLRRMKLQQARDEQTQAQQQGQGPTSALQIRIARTKQYLAQLERQLAQIQQSSATK